MTIQQFHEKTIDFVFECEAKGKKELAKQALLTFLALRELDESIK